MSWTVDFGAWPQKWEELPEQIAVTNKETGEWDAYMLTSKAMRMIRDAKDDANWLNAELHGVELKAERTCKNEWKIGFLCSECGAAISEPTDISYCVGCGAKVVKE